MEIDRKLNLVLALDKQVVPCDRVVAAIPA